MEHGVTYGPRDGQFRRRTHSCHGFLCVGGTYNCYTGLNGGALCISPCTEAALVSNNLYNLY